MMNRYGRLLNPPSTTLNIQQNDLRKKQKKKKRKKNRDASGINFLTQQSLSRQRRDGVTAGKGE